MSIGLAVLLVVGAAGAGTWVALRENPPPVPRMEVQDFLDAWGRFDFAAMSTMVLTPPASFVAEHEQLRDGLRLKGAALEPGPVVRDGTRATATFRARLELEGLGEWSYDGRMSLVRHEDRWLIDWTPATIHPEMQPGQRLGRSRVWPQRAPILAAGDQPLTATGETVAIGVEPRRVRDRATLTAALKQHLEIEPARVNAALDKPGLRPDIFVPFVDLPRARFDTLRPTLEPVPGVVFRKQPGRVVAGGAGFARHIIGRTGEITAEQLEKLGQPYMAGDTVGFDGLEGALERQLAGAPSGEVRLLGPGGDSDVVNVLFTFPGTAPQPVRTTLDPEVQAAAEKAMEGVDKPAAIVALDVSTGSVLASTSRPLNEAFNRAFTGRYPPGSTFKVVTTTGLLDGAVTPSSTVACPATKVVEGKTFRNFEGTELGDITFTRAFAESCNTAFAALAEKLGKARLSAAAERFGFNLDYPLGLPAFGGRFPDPSDRAETAAAAIGQARVEASTLHMASVAAAVAAGRWRPPVLVVGAPPAAVATPGELDETVAATVRQLMTSVVENGSGAGAAVPGRDVAGKTGTAEFGAGNPLPTHAWFIGFSGKVGFAVLVEGGGVGGRVAAPIAARFVAALPG